MADHWKTPLTAPIELKDGTTLLTLIDAGRYVSERCPMRAEVVTHTAELLMAAAETGDEDDTAAATVQLRRLFGFYHWI